MVTPYGHRRVTYADYTASGRGADVHRGLHPRRGAAELRQHPHRVQRHRACRPRGCARTPGAIIRDAVGGDDETVVIFAGSGCTGAIAKLIGVLGLRIPSALEDRARLSDAHPRRRSGRSCSSGPTSTTPTRSRGASAIADVVTIPQDADGHIDLDVLRAAARRSTPTGRSGSARSRPPPTSPASSPTPSRSPTLLHEHGALSFWDFAAAAPYVDIEMYGRGRDEPTPRPTRTRSSSRPHKFIGGPSHARACSSCGASCSTNRVPDVPGGGTVAYVNPDDHGYLDRPRAPRGGRHARRSSRRSAPGWSSSSSRPSASRRSAAAEERFLAARGRGLARRARRSRSSATSTPSGCRSCRSSSRSPAGRYLHHNFVVAAAQRPVRHPVARRLLVRRPLRPPPARHRPRALPRVRARDHRRLRGHQARLGAGELQLLPLRHRRRLHHRGGAAGRARRLAAARRLPVRHRDRPLDATARAWSSRRSACTTISYDGQRACDAPTQRLDRGTRTCSPSSSATAPRSWPRPREPDLDSPDVDLSADFEHLRWFDLPAGALD